VAAAPLAHGGLRGRRDVQEGAALKTSDLSKVLGGFGRGLCRVCWERFWPWQNWRPRAGHPRDENNAGTSCSCWNKRRRVRAANDRTADKPRALCPVSWYPELGSYPAGPSGVRQRWDKLPALDPSTLRRTKVGAAADALPTRFMTAIRPTGTGKARRPLTERACLGRPRPALAGGEPPSERLCSG
jgi:hypothetical protein